MRERMTMYFEGNDKVPGPIKAIVELTNGQESFWRAKGGMSAAEFANRKQPKPKPELSHRDRLEALKTKADIGKYVHEQTGTAMCINGKMVELVEKGLELIKECGNDD